MQVGGLDTMAHVHACSRVSIDLHEGTRLRVHDPGKTYSASCIQV